MKTVYQVQLFIDGGWVALFMDGERARELYQRFWDSSTGLCGKVRDTNPVNPKEQWAVDLAGVKAIVINDVTAQAVPPVGPLAAPRFSRS